VLDDLDVHLIDSALQLLGLPQQRSGVLPQPARQQPD
jgi:hypothetical protein